MIRNNARVGEDGNGLTYPNGTAIDIHAIIDREEKKYDDLMMQRMINGQSSPMLNRFKKSIPE